MDEPDCSMAELRRSRMFTPIASTRSPVLADTRAAGAMDRGWIAPGNRLPTEHEICDPFDVSRETVGEALRALKGGRRRTLSPKSNLHCTRQGFGRRRSDVPQVSFEGGFGALRYDHPVHAGAHRTTAGGAGAANRDR